MADPGAKEEDLQAIRKEFGLDKTYVEQYIVFVSKLVRGDFGKSIYYRVSRPLTCTCNGCQPRLLLAGGGDGHLADPWHSHRDFLGGAGEYLA